MYWLIYLLHVKPYKEQPQYTAELFNEIVLWIMTYFMPIFSDYYRSKPEDLKRFGLLFLILLGCLIFGNIVFAIG